MFVRDFDPKVPHLGREGDRFYIFTHLHIRDTCK